MTRGQGRLVWSVAYAVMAGVVGLVVLGLWCIWRSGHTKKTTSHWSELFKRTSSHSPIFTTSTPTIQQPPTSATLQPYTVQSSSIAVGIRPASSSNNSNTSNKQYSNGNAAPVPLQAGTHDATLQLQTLLPQGVKITNIEAAAARGQQFVVGGMPNIIENCTQSAEMFYNPHQSFVARRFFRKQKQQRSMQKRNNMMIARQQQSHNDKDIFAGNSSKVNNTNIHTEVLDNSGTGTTGRNRSNRRKNLNMLCDNAEEDITADKGRRRLDRDKDRYRHKKRQNICRDNDPLQMQPQQLNMMRTVSQQCTLKYSSDNITGEMDFDGAAAAALDKSLGSNPTEPTYCNVVEMKMQFAAVAAANAAAIGPPDGMEKDNKSPRIFLNPMHNMYSMDSMDHQPPDLLLTLDHTTSPTHQPHNTTTIDQTSPLTDKQQPLSPPLLLDTPTTTNTNQSTSAATMTATVSCSSVCPSELDELYQQIRGGGVNNSIANGRRVGKSRSQIVLLDDGRRCNMYGGGDWLQHQHHWQSDSEVNNGYYDECRGSREYRRKGCGKGGKGETRL